MSVRGPLSGLSMLLLLLAILATACGGGSSYVQFSPAEATPTRVSTTDGRISVVIPPEALSDSVEVALTDRSLADAEAPGVAGRRLAVALELRGSMPAPATDTEAPPAAAASVSAIDNRFVPASLSGSVDISVQLGSAWPLATPLEVQTWNSASQRYEPASITATLAEDGGSLQFSLSEFGRYALYGPLPEEYPLAAPAAPQLLAAGSVVRHIAWQAVAGAAGYNLYRSAAGADSPSKLNGAALESLDYVDILSQPGAFDYSVTALRGNGVESAASPLLASPAVNFDIIASIGKGLVSAPGQLLFDTRHERLLVCDNGSAELLSLSPTGELLKRISRAGSVSLRDPAALAIDPQDGTVYLADRGYRQVFRLSPALGYMSRFGESGSGPGEFLAPSGIASDGTQLIVADSERNLLQRFTPQGVYLNDPLDPADAQLALSLPGTLCRLADNSLALADGGNARVLLIGDDWSAAGELLRPAADGALGAPAAVVADVSGNIYVSEPLARRVSVFDSSGEYLFQFGAEGLLHVEFGASGPLGLAYDPASGHLYVADPSAQRIAVFST